MVQVCILSVQQGKRRIVGRELVLSAASGDVPGRDIAQKPPRKSKSDDLRSRVKSILNLVVNS